jgi:hypothetical protein
MVAVAYGIMGRAVTDIKIARGVRLEEQGERRYGGAVTVITCTWSQQLWERTAEQFLLPGLLPASWPAWASRHDWLSNLTKLGRSMALMVRWFIWREGNDRLLRC